MHEAQAPWLELKVKITIAIFAPVPRGSFGSGIHDANQLWKPRRLRPALSFPVEAPNSAVPVLPDTTSFAFGMNAMPVETTLREPSLISARFSCRIGRWRTGSGLATRVVFPCGPGAPLRKG